MPPSGRDRWYNAGMSDERRKPKGLITATVMALGALLLTYVGGYFALCQTTAIKLPKRAPNATRPIVWPMSSRSRTFPHPIFQSAYAPMAWFEAKFRNERIAIWSRK